MKWKSRIQNPRRKKAMAIRSQVEAGIREFFAERGFLETKTPLLVPCPGMEPHIRPFRVVADEGGEESYYLPTSPEFAMKRLLVGGLERIFQICPAFRNEPRSIHHLPEFTILEWYRAHSGCEIIQRDTEDLFYFLALKIFGKPVLQFQNHTIVLTPKWPRLRVRDLFKDLVNVDLVKNNTTQSLAQDCQHLGVSVSPTDTWDDLFFKIWLNCIEPKLPKGQPVFVERYPASQAALAVLEQDTDGSFWAKRFEVFAGGLELGNAFQELTDPIEQRQRFIKDMELRSQIYGESFPKTPIDEEFLTALKEGLPHSGGIAVGVDRLVMLFADEPDIDYTVWI